MIILLKLRKQNSSCTFYRLPFESEHVVPFLKLYPSKSSLAHSLLVFPHETLGALVTRHTKLHCSRIIHFQWPGL